MLVLATFMVDQINSGLSWRHRHAMAFAMGSVTAAAYFWLSTRTPRTTWNRRYRWSLLTIGLVFSTGVTAGIIRAFVEGWDWSYVGMVVPAWIAWLCFKLLFHPRLETAAHRKISGSA